MAVVGQYTVYVHDADGVLHTLSPGDEVPEWAAGLLGEHCYGAAEDSAPEPAPAAPDAVAAPSDGPPPQSGRGASESAWCAYAEANGVDVSGLEGRSAFIAACEDAGVPV